MIISTNTLKTKDLMSLQAGMASLAQKVYGWEMLVKATEQSEIRQIKKQFKEFISAHGRMGQDFDSALNILNIAYLSTQIVTGHFILRGEAVSLTGEFIEHGTEDEYFHTQKAKDLIIKANNIFKDLTC